MKAMPLSFLFLSFLYAAALCGSVLARPLVWPKDGESRRAEARQRSVLSNPVFTGNRVVRVNHAGGGGFISFAEFLDAVGTENDTTYVIEKSDSPYVVGCRLITIGDSSAGAARRRVVVRGSTGNRGDVTLVGADPAVDPNFWKSAEYGGPSGCRATKVFAIYNAEHIVFADMTLKNFAGKIIAIDGGLDDGVEWCGRNVLLHNLDMSDCGSQFIKVAGPPVSSRDCVLEFSRIHYTDGLFVESTYQTQGIDVHRGRGWIVRDNVFENIRMRAGTPSWGTAILFWNDSSDILIERNFILNCDFAIVAGQGDEDPTDNVMIRNNVIVYDDGSGAWKPNDVFATKTKSTLHGGFLHNTVFNPYTGGNAFAVCYSAFPVRNNIYVSGTTHRCKSQRDNVVAAVSLFADPAAYDFRMKENRTVPAIDGLDRDVDGRARANPPTAGAYEYSE